MGLVNRFPIFNKRLGVIPNVEETMLAVDPQDNKGQRAKQKRKNRIMDEIRFQSRKRNRK